MRVGRKTHKYQDEEQRPAIKNIACCVLRENFPHAYLLLETCRWRQISDSLDLFFASAQRTSNWRSLCWGKGDLYGWPNFKNRSACICALPIRLGRRCDQFVYAEFRVANCRLVGAIALSSHVVRRSICGACHLALQQMGAGLDC